MCCCFILSATQTAVSGLLRLGSPYIQVNIEIKRISLSVSVLITPFHVQTDDCSLLNPCDELVSDGELMTAGTSTDPPAGHSEKSLRVFNMNTHNTQIQSEWRGFTVGLLLGTGERELHETASIILFPFPTSLHHLSLHCLCYHPILLLFLHSGFLGFNSALSQPATDLLMFIANQVDAVKE